MVILAIILLPFTIVSAIWVSIFGPTKGSDLTAKEMIKVIAEILPHTKTEENLLQYFVNNNIEYFASSKGLNWDLSSRVEIYKYTLEYNTSSKTLTLYLDSSLAGISPYSLYILPNTTNILINTSDNLVGIDKEMVIALKDNGARSILEVLGA